MGIKHAPAESQFRSVVEHCFIGLSDFLADRFNPDRGGDVRGLFKLTGTGSIGQIVSRQCRPAARISRVEDKDTNRFDQDAP
jgi:hypothetical protein